MFDRRRLPHAVLAATLLLAPLSAVAATQSAHATSPRLARTSTPTYQTNGRVTAILVVKNTVYIGGDFTAVRPPGAASGAQEVARAHLAAFRVDTGRLRSWNPHPNGSVAALAASADGRTIYVGGSFTKLAGAHRHNVGAVAVRTGRATPFRANTDGPVLALCRSWSRLYVGGSFSKVKRQARHHVAAVDVHRRGRLIASWHPRPNSTVRSIRTAVHGTRVYLGGQFSKVNKHWGPYLAKVSSDGKLLPWWHHPGFPVWSMVVGPHRVFAGGNGPGGHIIAFTPRGKKLWRVDADGGVQTIAKIHGGIVAGGHFRNVCDGMIRGDCVNVISSRNKLMSVNPLTGALNRWNPSANSGMGVFALATAGPVLYVGGMFTEVNDMVQQGFDSFLRS